MGALREDQDLELQKSINRTNTNLKFMQNPVPNCNFAYLDMYSIAYIEGNVKDTKNKTKFDHQNFYFKKKFKYAPLRSTFFFFFQFF